MRDDPPGEDGPSPGPLHDVTAGDSAARQLRERYELLQRDYHILLERLGELEGRLRGIDEPETPPAPPPAAPSPYILREHLRAPLLHLRQEYDRAIEELRDLVEGLDLVASGRMKRQRGAGPAADAHSTLRLDVSAGSPASILDFQERLAAIPGVSRVSIEAIEQDRATLTVELNGSSD